MKAKNKQLLAAWVEKNFLDRTRLAAAARGMNVSDHLRNSLEQANEAALKNVKILEVSNERTTA